MSKHLKKSCVRDSRLGICAQTSITGNALLLYSKFNNMEKADMSQDIVHILQLHAT
ncbi:protein of unknown function [Xenorhabdus doucetiae]|uniref:Uncharacterized protein n=1 Tax=Xenorhabdus doucetiae TaxID=351671 RepID=A0A068QNS1_9GAMM|nr:protein of unknown function [Xenorhabdus doucetiae]